MAKIYDITATVFYYDKRKERHTVEERFCSRYDTIAAIEVREVNWQRLKTKKYAKENVRIEKIISAVPVGTWEEKLTTPKARV